MPCAMVVNVVEEGRVEFKCSTCERVIGFVKPGYGTPEAIPDGAGSWTPPENFLDWMDPCP